MVQAAWMEKGGVKWSLAVMTDDNPTKSYGWDTQKGTTGLLLGQAADAGLPGESPGVTRGRVVRAGLTPPGSRSASIVEVAVALGRRQRTVAPTRASSSASASGET